MNLTKMFRWHEFLSCEYVIDFVCLGFLFSQLIISNDYQQVMLILLIALGVTFVLLGHDDCCCHGTHVNGLGNWIGLYYYH